MDTLDTDRNIIQDILLEYAGIPYAHGDIQSQVVFDSTHDRYLLVTVGWQGKERVHGALVHVDIINGKFWIQRDGTEEGIAGDLVRAGIPKDRIVLGFRNPKIRPHTGFAVA